MNRITILSRYGEPRYFIPVEEGYKLEGDFNFVRAGHTSSGNYYIDFDGGPWLSIGMDLSEEYDVLEGVITEIIRLKGGYLIKTK